MKKIQKLENALIANQKEISTLQTFRQTKPVKQLVRQLFAEQDFIKRQLAKLKSVLTPIPKEERNKKANQRRSEKMKRSWHYFKAIKENYPVKMSLRELRSAFTRYKRGLETDVEIVMWRNPSP